MGHQTT